MVLRDFGHTDSDYSEYFGRNGVRIPAIEFSWRYNACIFAFIANGLTGPHRLVERHIQIVC
jgi:hypothetical protein